MNMLCWTIFNVFLDCKALPDCEPFLRYLLTSELQLLQIYPHISYQNMQPTCTLLVACLLACIFSCVPWGRKVGLLSFICKRSLFVSIKTHTATSSAMQTGQVCSSMWTINWYYQNLEAYIRHMSIFLQHTDVWRAVLHVLRNCAFPRFLSCQWESSIPIPCDWSIVLPETVTCTLGKKTPFKVMSYLVVGKQLSIFNPTWHLFQ